MKQYSKIKVKSPGLSLHNLSHELKTTLDMGTLYPICCEEVLPGDRHIIDTQMLLRLQPMLAPIMHRVNVYIHYFSVPYRLIWDNAENFFTGGENGTSLPNLPKFTGTYNEWYNVMNGADPVCRVNSLADALGIPVVNIKEAQGSIPAEDFPAVSQLPFRAYQLIYNEYYRNQNFEIAVPIKTNDADYNIGHADVLQMLLMRKRAWEKDYFTSCLPTTQRGTDVSIGVSGTAGVQGKIFLESQTSPGTMLVNKDLSTDASGQVKDKIGSLAVIKRNSEELYVDSDGTTLGIDYNDFRLARALQMFKEKAMRGGARYTEVIKNFFGVRSSDARQQRPEYLGGGKVPISISEVLQLGQSSVTPQGNMAGHGVAGANPCSINATFEEHGFIIGIMSIMPRTGYAQGLDRKWFKFDKFDYFWPELAHIGEQEILKKEVYVSEDDSAENEQLFGYNERDADYRSINDRVRGDLRDSMKFWSLYRDFDNNVELNSDFIIANPSKRIFPVVSGDTAETYRKCITYIYFDWKAIRPVPKYGTPL